MGLLGKRGTLLNMNILHFGDCLEVMKRMPSKSINMILCDLPYGITACKWDKVIPLNLLWEQYERIAKESAAICLFGKQPFTTDVINSNRKYFRYSITWIKNIANGYLNAKVMPLQVTEDIIIFYKNKPTYHPQMEDGFVRKTAKASTKRKCKAAEVYQKAICIKDYDSSKRYPINVLYYPSDKHKVCLHPTQKPVALLEYLIKTYTNVGDTVLDNCMGSGTTGIACQHLSRDFIGIELNEQYFEIASQRIESEVNFGGDIFGT